MAGADEFEEIEVHPIRSIRVELPEDQSMVAVLRLATGPAGTGQQFAFLVAAETLEQIVQELSRAVRDMPKPKGRA